MCKYLTKLINHNTKVLALQNNQPKKVETCFLHNITPFDSSTIPQLPLESFLTHLHEHMPGNMVGTCFTSVVMLAYAERIRKIKTDFVLNAFNVHRFFLATLVISHKLYSDDCYLNSYIAKLGGISSEELNNLELCLLNWLDFNLYITPADFFSYKSFLTSLDKLAIMNYAVLISDMKLTLFYEQKLRHSSHKIGGAKVSVPNIGVRTKSISPVSFHRENTMDVEEDVEMTSDKAIRS